MATTTYGSISQRTAAWASTEALAHAMPVEVLARYGQSKPIPKNTADGAKFRRAVPFAAATTPLAEGTPPTAHTISYVDVPVTLAQYGDVVEITDKVHDMAEDPVLKDAMQLNGEQAAETLELILWGVLQGGTARTFTNGTARNQVNTALTGAGGLAIIRNAVRALKSARAKMVTSMLSGSVNYKTEPVAAGFVAFGHTNMETDLRGIPGFVPVELYGAATKALPFEVGKVENVRFVLSPVLTPFADAGGTKGTMMSTSGTLADVYSLVIVAANAYGLTALRGAGAITPAVLNPNVPRGGDPLGQKGTVGWKTYFAAVRLNETWMHRIEAAVTA